MRNLSFIIILLLTFLKILSQSSPHGENFKIECAKCHTSENWKVDPSKIQFDHNKTDFPLEGGHNIVDCRSCHESLKFNAVNEKIECANCHKDIHQNSVGTNCMRCHSPKSWIIENIADLHRTSRFPLVGNHAKADCVQCHKSISILKFDVLSIRCYDCHQQDFISAQIPNHVQGNFSIDCQQCHQITALNWATQTINHSFFPLVGGHAINNCFACHLQNTFAGLSENCYSCHKTNYNSAPNHVAQSYPTDCKMCHSINSWTSSTFNHSATSFPLTGAHTTLVCANCHTKGFNAGATPTDCYSCHTAEFTSALNHVAQSYPHDCTLCHSTITFTNSTFNHATTSFPLTGFHTTLACGSCHTKGFAAGATPTLCSGCHMNDFNSTTNPNHVTAQFPTTCDQCHNTTAWTPSTFTNHDSQYFPIYSGRHNGVWSACSDCHNNSANYSVFTCIACHTHSNQTSVTSQHSGVRNFTYTPTSCYSCHPKGTSD